MSFPPTEVADSGADYGTLRCPTCGARQQWSDACRRCKCDLSLVRQVLCWRRQLHRNCLRALRAGRTVEAGQFAQAMCDISSDEVAARLLAVCRLLEGDFAAALAVRQSMSR